MITLTRSSVLGICLLLLAALGSTGQVAAEEPRTDLYGDPLPKGASARLGTIRFRQGGHSMVAVAFLPDNKTVLVAGEESSIKFWEAESGKLMREIRTDPMSVRGCAVSRDGKQLAVCGYWYPEDRTKGPQAEVRLLDSASGALVKTLTRDSRDADHCGLAFSPDGKLLFSIGTSGVLRVEEVLSGVKS